MRVISVTETFFLITSDSGSDVHLGGWTTYTCALRERLALVINSSVPVSQETIDQIMNNVYAIGGVQLQSSAC